MSGRTEEDTRCLERRHPTSGVLTSNVLEMTKEERLMEEALTPTALLVVGSLEHRLATCRALLLDVSFRPIDVLSWQVCPASTSLRRQRLRKEGANTALWLALADLVILARAPS